MMKRINMTDYETIKRKHSHALRGLKEVQTDKVGKDLINEAVKSFNLITKIQEKHISQIEMDNEQMMLELTDQTEIRMEHQWMKRALNTTAMIDKLVTDHIFPLAEDTIKQRSKSIFTIR